MIFKNYIPAELRNSKLNWYVLYYVINPQTGKLQRKEIRVNRIRSINERKKFARKLISEINEKLYSGWNPFIEQEAPRAYTKLIDALDIYLRAKKKEFTSVDSIRTYQSYVDLFKNYIIDIAKKPDILVFSFDNYEVKNYMDYLYNVRNVSGVTYNNYKNKLITIWNYFIENLYCKVNPFLAVKRKMEKTKTRQIIDNDTRRIIKDYLIEKNDYEFLAMIMLCFHGLIRPKEICLLKSEYINLEQNIIFLPAKITKDKDDRIVTISEDLKFYLNKINISIIPKDYYIFSTSFKPGPVLKNTRDIGKKWSSLRSSLNLPMEYQFYSLKDSGIVQKFRDGINPLEIRDQAGHSTLEQTNVYAKYANQKGGEDIKTKSSEF